jgi:hypothetical protein
MIIKGGRLGSLRQIIAVFVTAALTLSLSVTLTVTSAKQASASCVASASGFGGTWRSSDDRLSRIDVWPGEDCQLYARAWSTCEDNARRDCSWGNKELKAGSQNFRFFYYNWSNANEVLHLRLKDKTHMSVWDHVDYKSGKKTSFTVVMVKDR